MIEEFVIVGLLVISLGDGASRRPGNSCGLIKLKADRLTREFTSPGYPRHFTAQTQCTWLIEAPRTERVKLKIKDFFLTSDERCEGQYVSFSDIAANRIYGPICGKRNGGEIISTGNKLQVKLESDSISRTKRYKGFKFLYTKTKEQPSFPSRGRVRNGRPTPATRADVIVDDNNNEVINARNRQVNERQEEESQRMNGENARNYETVLPPSLKTGKISPRVNRATVPPRRWLSDRKGNGITTRKQRPPSKQEKDKSGISNGDSTKKYVAIAMSGSVLMILFTFIVVKLRRKRKETSATTHSEGAVGTRKYTTQSRTKNVTGFFNAHSGAQIDATSTKSEYFKSHNLPSVTATATDLGVPLSRLQIKSFHKNQRSDRETSMPNKTRNSTDRIKTEIRCQKSGSAQGPKVIAGFSSQDREIPKSKKSTREKRAVLQKHTEDERPGCDRKKGRTIHHHGVSNTAADVQTSTSSSKSKRTVTNHRPTRSKQVAGEK